MATIVTEEEELVHNGETLPILSSSAKNMRMDKLLATPLPTYDSTIPGSYFWTKVAFWMCRRVAAIQFRTTSSTREAPLEQGGGGSMCCAWHTNGLMDPLGVFLHHPKEFVVGGRHDLVTRPLLGWWTRKLAVQPVVRKAELLRGGCTEDEAQHINGRSLLALASGITHGFGCVLFPEGTSHDNSHMIRFRTGPFRTVLAAAALAKANNLPMPTLLPVGLHYRRREYFRTDKYIEFGEPLALPEESIPDELVEAVAKGSWVEPPAEMVFAVRDKLQEKLPEYTAHTDSWEEHRGVHLLAHVEARMNNTPLATWQDEVHAARVVKNKMRTPSNALPPLPLEGVRIADATEAAEILENQGLDGRDLNSAGNGLRRANPLHIVPVFLRTLLFLTFLPFSVTSLGFQVALGRLLGDSTDEGLDARTSYQFLAAFFGSLLVWPLIAALWLGAAFMFHESLTSLVGFDWRIALGESGMLRFVAASLAYLALFPVFWFSGKTFSWTWDDYVDSRKAWRRRWMKDDDRQNLTRLLKNLLEANETVTNS